MAELIQYPLLTTQNWGVITGCTKVSSGCKNCYAETHLGKDLFNNVKVNESLIFNPPKWKPGQVDLAECGDWLHDTMPIELIEVILKQINIHPMQTFVALTKRVERLQKIFENRILPKNLWVGVSVEDQATANYRIPFLKYVNGNRLVSVQPLLERITLPQTKIALIIAGQEWGPTYRPMQQSWIQHLSDQSQKRNIMFSYQQRMVGTKREMFPKLGEN